MTSDSNHPLVIGLTGASGAIYGVRLLQTLLALGRETHLAISPSGWQVLQHELGLHITQESFDPAEFLSQAVAALTPYYGQKALNQPTKPQIQLHQHDDYLASIASGSFRTAGMVICPCSGGTLAAIASGLSANLIQRAAGVHLKELRPLILVPRETPLSLVYLDNLRRVHEAGAVVLPAMPGWYAGVTCPGDLVDFVVARILDQLHIEHDLSSRWGT